MSMFKIDAQTTLRKWFGATMMVFVMLIMFILLSPFILIGLTLEMIAYFTGFEFRWFDILFDFILGFLNVILDYLIKWITVVAVSKKAEVWHELNRTDEKEE